MYWQTLASALSGHTAGTLRPEDQQAAAQGSAQLLEDIAELDAAAFPALPTNATLIPCMHAQHGMPHISFCSVCERSMPGCMYTGHLADCKPTPRVPLLAPSTAPSSRAATPTPTASAQSLPAIKHPKKRRTGASKLSRQSNAMLPPSTPTASQPAFAPPHPPSGHPTPAPLLHKPPLQPPVPGQPPNPLQPASLQRPPHVAVHRLPQAVQDANPWGIQARGAPLLPQTDPPNPPGSPLDGEDVLLMDVAGPALLAAEPPKLLSMGNGAFLYNGASPLPPGALQPHSFGWGAPQYAQQPYPAAGMLGGFANPLGSSLLYGPQSSLPYFACQPTSAVPMHGMGPLGTLGQQPGPQFLASAQGILRAAASPQGPPSLGLQLPCSGPASGLNGHASGLDRHLTGSVAAPSGYKAQASGQNVPVMGAAEDLLDSQLRPAAAQLGRSQPAHLLTSWPPSAAGSQHAMHHQLPSALPLGSLPTPGPSLHPLPSSEPAVKESVCAALQQSHSVSRNAEATKHLDKRPRLSSGDHPLSSPHHTSGSGLHRKALAAASKDSSSSCGTGEGHTRPRPAGSSRRGGSETRTSSEARAGAKNGLHAGAASAAAAASAVHQLVACQRRPRSHVPVRYQSCTTDLLVTSSLWRPIFRRKLHPGTFLQFLQRALRSR